MITPLSPTASTLQALRAIRVSTAQLSLVIKGLFPLVGARPSMTASSNIILGLVS